MKNVLVVAVAVVPIAVRAVVLLVDRGTPRRKRIGYQVRMDAPIGEDAPGARST